MSSLPNARDTDAMILPSTEVDAGLFPSELTSFFINIPQGMELEQFSFEGRRYLLPVYDIDARNMLLMCGRQVEKTTTLGNRTLVYSLQRPFFKSLYVSPTQTQTETFSRDRLESPITQSPRMQPFIRNPQNVLLKRFKTNAEITLRYAYLSADRTRGIRADLLCIDELQDVLLDIIPIMEECLSHSPYKMKLYAGTPKSLDNTISYYWEEYSTKNEWVIPCDHCPPEAGRWNVVGMDNIGKKHLICTRCGNQIYPEHPQAQWAAMRSPEWLKNPPIENPFHGFHIPQLITSWLEWGDILDKLRRYPPAQFYNEVLGLGYDYSTKLVDRDALIGNCDPNRKMDDGVKWKGRIPVFMGIDWGGGGELGNSYTLVTIGGYIKDRFTILYAKRYEGTESASDYIMASIKRLINEWKVVLVGTDHGGGYMQNDDLIRTFGIKRIFRYQYVKTKKIYYDAHLSRWMVNRTEVLMAFVNAINRGDTFTFPRWEEFETPFGTDYLAVHGEFNESNETMTITRSPGTTDDSLHSLAYCFLASMIKHPRPDIITPVGDDP